MKKRGGGIKENKNCTLNKYNGEKKSKGTGTLGGGGRVGDKIPDFLRALVTRYMYECLPSCVCGGATFSNLERD